MGHLPEMKQYPFLHFGGGFVGECHRQDMAVSIGVRQDQLQVFRHQPEGFSGPCRGFVDGKHNTDLLMGIGMSGH